MPHHRVSESLPAQLGSFDLVVIDESSQSDLSALPILLRAKKLLVVGDDRQVSPQAIGTQEERIHALMQRHLAEQVPLYRAQLSPDRSLYDLARVVFADSSVMLREHFRCVAPIIEYARREFYNNEVYPLRLPRARSWRSSKRSRSWWKRRFATPPRAPARSPARRSSAASALAD